MSAMGEDDFVRLVRESIADPSVHHEALENAAVIASLMNDLGDIDKVLDIVAETVRTDRNFKETWYDHEAKMMLYSAARMLMTVMQKPKEQWPRKVQRRADGEQYVANLLDTVVAKSYMMMVRDADGIFKEINELIKEAERRFEKQDFDACRQLLDTVAAMARDTEDTLMDIEKESHRERSKKYVPEGWVDRQSEVANGYLGRILDLQVQLPGRIHRAHPSQLLEYQALVKDYMSDRVTINYIQNFMDSSRSTPHHRHLFPDDMTGEQWCQMEAMRLKMAYCYQVTPAMCDLVAWAAETLPDSETLEPHMLPSEYGFLWLDKTHKDIDIQKRIITTRFFTWGIRTEEVEGYQTNPVTGQRSPMRLMKRRGVRFNFYTDRDDPDDDVSRDLRNSPHWDNHPLAKQQYQLQHSVFFAFGTEPRETDHTPERWKAVGVKKPAVVSDMHRWFIAYCKLMGQELVATQDEELDRRTRRRAKHHGIPDRVIVVMLRRKGHSAKGETFVEWAYQTIVKGHWKRQPYKNEKGEWDHKHIYINPYLRGPEDKPLHVTDKVYKLGR
jgi:hypothetical protein